MKVPTRAPAERVQFAGLLWYFKYFFRVIIGGLLALGLCLPAHAKRIALVIGNDAYQNVTKLNKAGNDATAMARELTAAGFEVQLHRDLNYRGMVKAIETLSKRISGGDEVMVFFAGHGVQIKTGSYMLPVDIEATTESEVEKTAYGVTDLTEKLSEAKAAFALVVVDACRDNPLKTSGRSVGNTRGLSAIEPPKGQMVIYSASRGQQALDRLSDRDTNPNGVFTREFIAKMKKPGVKIQDLVIEVQDSVEALAQTVKHEQRPAIYNEARGNFYFFAPINIEVVQKPPILSEEQKDEKFWEEAKVIGNKEAFEAYSQIYPAGRFINLAKANILRLDPLKQPLANSSIEKQPATIASPQPNANPISSIFGYLQNDLLSSSKTDQKNKDDVQSSLSQAQRVTIVSPRQNGTDSPGFLEIEKQPATIASPQPNANPISSIVGYLKNNLLSSSKTDQKNKDGVQSNLSQAQRVTIVSPRQNGTDSLGILESDKNKTSEIVFSWPHGGSIFRKFGEKDSTGIDIVGLDGDPVLAAADGQVVYSGELTKYGNVVTIRHDSNTVTSYTHNKVLLVKSGQDVQKGQKIAQMGPRDSGQVMLSFRVVISGKPSDPLEYLPARESLKSDAVSQSAGSTDMQVPNLLNSEREKAVNKVEQDYGLTVRELTEAQRNELKVKGGVRIEAAINGAARAGLREGDVILAAINTDIASVKDLEAILAKHDKAKPLNVLYRRGGGTQFAVIKPLN